MTISAEFTETRPGADELLVHYIDDFLSKSTHAVERFTSSTSTITFEKQWKHTFPEKVVWFIGNKNYLENLKEIRQKK